MAAGVRSGDVRADLIAAGRIPARDTPEGIAAGQWVDDKRLVVSRGVADSTAPDETLILEADGIDYQSAIWLDGMHLGAHMGAFARQAVHLPVEIWRRRSARTGDPHLGGRRCRARPVACGRRLARRHPDRIAPGIEYFPDRMRLRKAQFSFGGTSLPLADAGIWDDIRLIRIRNAYIEDLWARPISLITATRRLSAASSAAA